MRDNKLSIMVVRKRTWILAALVSLLVPTLLLFATSLSAQVSPAEIVSPDLKAAEAEYLPQLIAANHEIAKAHFPFPFYLSRYVGLDPAEQVETDSRGIEFVRFQDRVVLKITGNYNAAYDSRKLTQNERAARTFRDVVLPALRAVTSSVPADVACDAIGFEIAHHARTRQSSYDYEGKEILVVVLDREDAFAMAKASDEAAQQDILNRSKVYLNGGDFGLSLKEKDPFNVQALQRSVPKKIDATSTAGSSVAVSRLARVNPRLVGDAVRPDPLAPGVPAAKGSNGDPAIKPEPDPPPAVRTPAEADQLDEKFRPQLDELAKIGVAKFHFVDYAAPTFIVFGNRLALQMTMRNSLKFDVAKGSIYKRAAQTFDLFLAPQLKDILEKIPAQAEFQSFDFAVLNQLTTGTAGSSEALEFICPRELLRQFANAEITNQKLIDESVVLVNGVRIALNLQLVE